MFRQILILFLASAFAAPAEGQAQPMQCPAPLKAGDWTVEQTDVPDYDLGVDGPATQAPLVAMMFEYADVSPLLYTTRTR